MTAVYALAVLAVLWLVYAWHRASHRTLIPPTDYGPMWPRRRLEFWHELGGRYCEVCNTHRRPLRVHHRYGAGNRWPIGREPQRALLGVCTRCHDRIHRKHRRLIRLGLDREPYRRLDNVTRRALWLGAWRRLLRRKPR